MKDIEELELKISKFLRAGVIFAALLMLIGWIISFKLKGNIFFNFETYDHIPFQNQIMFVLANEKWGTIFEYSGLIVLISLPVIRVFLTAILFLRQKDYLLAAISLVVLSALAISFTFGIEL